MQFEVGDMVYINDKCSVEECIGFYGIVYGIGRLSTSILIDGHLDINHKISPRILDYMSKRTHIKLLTRSFNLLLITTNRQALQILPKR
jgi:hypothetical protein